MSTSRSHRERAPRDPPEPSAAGPSDHLFRLLVGSVRDYAIFALDADGRIVTWNPGAELLKGYRANEILGRHFSVFYPDDDVARGKPASELRIAAEYGRYDEEGWRLRKDGSRFWANVVITAMRERPDGPVIGFSKVTRDLTERRQAEEALRQSEEKFRLLVEGVTDYAIFVLDLAGRIQSWNKGAERVTGWRPSEVVGESFLRLFPPEDVATGKPERELKIAFESGRYEEEGWRMRKDGTRFWANVIVTPLRDPTSKAHVGYAKVTRDLTLRRRAEQELRSAYQDMEAFSYTASHDLRAPLRAVAALAEHALQDNADLPIELRNDLSAILTSTKRASALVDDLLQFARLAPGDLKLSLVDVGEIAQEIVGDLRAREPARQVDLVIEKPQELNVTADPALVRVMLTNLVENAWKFTQRTEKARITVGAGRDGGTDDVFYVSDNGVGFAPNVATRLFQPFQRFHEAKHFSGTGIGLATVRRIAEKHGGHVWAEGKPGEGATFFVALPHAAP